MNQNEIESALLAIPTDISVFPSVRHQASQEYRVQSRSPAQRDDAQIAYMQNIWPRPEEIAEHIFKQPHRAKAIAVPIGFLLDAGGVIYGSRGLHVENQYSDYDFAFSYEEHKRLFHILTDSDIATSIPSEYFSSVPEAGYRTFFQYEGLDPVTNAKVKVDVIFVNNDEDLDVIRSSVQDLQSIPQYMIRDKKFRIDAYNKALQHRGWKLNPDLRNNRRDPQTAHGIRGDRGPFTNPDRHQAPERDRHPWRSVTWI